MKEPPSATKVRYNLSRPSKRSLKVTAALVIAASLVSVLLALLDYPVIGHDAYAHLNWLYQFPRLFADGIIYPRWLPGSFGGFGAPSFYFYAPLVYWIGSLFHLLGINLSSALYQIDELFFSFFSLFTSYLLLRHLGRRKFLAFLGALVYSTLAYRFCDVFIRDALTEHAALAFLPIVFFRYSDRLRSILLYSIGWIGLFLTNLPITYTAVVAVIIILCVRRSSKEAISQLPAFMIAVAVSAIYLFPAIALRGLVQPQHLFDLPMNTSRFGFALLDLLHGHFDWLRILSIITFMAGILLLIVFRKNGSARGEGSEWFWLIIAAVFLQVPIMSAPFWYFIPGLHFVQFSWRWNGVLLLVIVVVCSGEIPNVDTNARRLLKNGVLAGLALVTLATEATISRHLFSRPPVELNSYLLDAPEYATKWAASDPSEVIGVTLRRMNEPAGVLLGLTMPGDSISLRSKTSTEWELTTHLSRPTPARFHQFYWPYWKAFAGLSELSMKPDPNGFATALLPAGNVSITLKLVKSPAEKIGVWISLAGAFAFAILMAMIAYRSITNRWDTTVPPELTRKI